MGDVLSQSPDPLPDRRDPTRPRRRDTGRRATDVVKPEFVSVEHVAERLDVDARTVWKWIEAGHLPVYKFPSRVTKIRSVDVEDFIAKHLGSPPVAPGI